MTDVKKKEQDFAGQENENCDNEDVNKKENCQAESQETEQTVDESALKVDSGETSDDKNPGQMEEEELLEKVHSLEKELSYMEEEKDKYYKKMQRLQADFVNYRKRTKREKEGLSLKAKIELINDILPVIDNFERALDSHSEESDFKKGIEMIYKQLINNLKQQGLKEIAAVGEIFNHVYHEAIMQVEDTDEESGVIIEELQKGYMFGDKVVRPAMVKVAK